MTDKDTKQAYKKFVDDEGAQGPHHKRGFIDGHQGKPEHAPYDVAAYDKIYAYEEGHAHGKSMKEHQQSHWGNGKGNDKR